MTPVKTWNEIEFFRPYLVTILEALKDLHQINFGLKKLYDVSWVLLLEQKNKWSFHANYSVIKGYVTTDYFSAIVKEFSKKDWKNLFFFGLKIHFPHTGFLALICKFYYCEFHYCDFLKHSINICLMWILGYLFH